MPAWNLAHTTYGQVKNEHYEVAVLPLGATEPHNLHLPYSTDTIEGDEIGGRVCAAAAERGAKVVLLPTMPFGTERNLSAFPLALNVNPSTLYAVVTDLVESLVGSGIRKILLMNMHGGNEMKPFLREMYGQTEAKLFCCNWWQMVSDVAAEVLEQPEDHAGEMETSILLATRPELVARESDGRLAADAGTKRPCRFEAVERGWVSLTRPWHLLTTNAGSANPHAATAEKGELILQAIVDRLAPFLVELSEAEVDASFPY